MDKDFMKSDILNAPSNDSVVAIHRRFEQKRVGEWKGDVIIIDARIKNSGILWTLNLYPIAVSTINCMTGVVGLDCYDQYYIARWKWENGKAVGELRKLTDMEKVIFWQLCGGFLIPQDD